MQSAIAAEPKAAFKSYILGGLLWLPIPFAFAASLGLAAASLDLPVTEEEANQGLIAVAAAQYILGKGVFFGFHNYPSTSKKSYYYFFQFLFHFC